MNGVNLVGVQFQRAGKVFEYINEDLPVSVGDRVIVETERGQSLGQIVKIYFAEKRQDEISQLKPLIKLANDEESLSQAKFSSDEAIEIAREKVRKWGLDMRVLSAEIQLKGAKVLVYFTAPGRVDFRHLVKDLAGAYRARVELKQVGARDEAKLVGGLGICGREFCCSSFLREFVPVSIKMAKNQNLALNPTKVSGGCGRLLCCLTYEDDTYSFLRKQMLPIGTRVRLKTGEQAEVLRGDILNQEVLVESASGEQLKVQIQDLEVLSRGQETESDETTQDWADDIDLKALLEGEPAEQD